MREKERGKYVIDVRPWGYKGKRVRLPFEGGYEDALRYHNEVLAQFGCLGPHGHAYPNCTQSVLAEVPVA